MHVNVRGADNLTILPVTDDLTVLPRVQEYPTDAVAAANAAVRPRRVRGNASAEAITTSCVLIAAGLICIVMVMSVVCAMHHGGHGHANDRVPPSWDPANQASYSFRDWAHEVVIWSIAPPPLDERRKAAAA